MHDTRHSKIDLSPEIRVHKTAGDVMEDKGEISIWSCLPTERGEEEKHIVLCLDSIYGHSIRFTELTPDQAREIARVLTRHADEVEAYDLNAWLEQENA